MKFVLMQEVEADSLAVALPKFVTAPIIITPTPTIAQPIQPAEPNVHRIGTQSKAFAVLQSKGKERSAKDVANKIGLTIKQTCNALTNLRNKGMVRSNVHGWYKL